MTFDYFPGAFWSREDFTYADGAGYGPNFTMHSGSTGRLYGNHPTLRALSNGAGEVADWGAYNKLADGDDMRTTFTLVNPTPYTLATDQEFVLSHRNINTANSLTYGVWFTIVGSTAAIISMINGTQTQRASAAAGSNLIGVPLMYESKGNVHQCIRLDTGATVVGWNDSGALAAKGATYRTMKMAITGWWPIFQQQYVSPVPDFVDFAAAA
ncbi:hypothetical protein [Nocardia phage KYD2]|nr:hypothetical protein [Nocardia phage KYD2]